MSSRSGSTLGGGGGGGLSAGHHKLAEKLSLINDRGVGMLTRIYNIKKACGDAKSKPAFLSDKTLESAIKYIVRRFPNVDIKGLQAITPIRNDIIKSLSLYYYTFVDLLDFKDQVCELLTTMDACQIHLDITVNYELTRAYLDLVATYVALMVLLSRVEDRKAVLGLFNAAHEMVHNQSDLSFPRLGQMIVDYEQPVRRLADEFVPHTKLLSGALRSLWPVYVQRNLTADKWRSDQKLSLVGNPAQLLKPSATDTVSCEYLSLETMERWIIFGFLLCHQNLQPQPPNQQQHNPDGNVAHKLWIAALESNYSIALFRDETVPIHSFVQSFFETLKGYSKKVSEVKEAHTHATQKAVYRHRERRKYLRTALKELAMILTDQPGLLGPKVLLVFIGLSLARDEVCWLLRHGAPNSGGGNNQKNAGTGTGGTGKSSGKSSGVEDLLVDRQLPELLFHMEELRMLVRKYSQVVQRYYVQYLVGFDAIQLAQSIQSVYGNQQDQQHYQQDPTFVILQSIVHTISALSVKQVEDNELFDLRALRLDWFRVQAYCSSAGSGGVGGGYNSNNSKLNLFDHRQLASQLDTAAHHTRMVDYLDEMLVDTSDLSLFCFYNKTFEDQFHMCLEFPAQNRYIIAFPLVCGHFQSCAHELCPEERHHIRERSLSVVNMFLDDMAKEAKNILTTVCDEQCTMSDRLLPKHCALLIAQAVNRKKKDKSTTNSKGKNAGTSMLLGGAGDDNDRPGSESYRKTREELTTMDKLHMALTELCYALNYCATINVWEYTFAPREYLHQHLETRFGRALVGMAMFNADTGDIAKPSELLASVRAYMSVLQTVENYVHIDVTRVFNNALLQQTQHADSHGDKTIASSYTQWYSEVLLRRVSAGNICYSPNQRAFVSLTADGAVPFNAEEFSDIGELRALAELVGPYGMKLLNETLTWHVASQVQELKKLVAANRDVLLALRTNFDKPDVMKTEFKKLQHVDNVLQRMTIVGVILSFRQLAQSALRDVLEDRVPFLLASIQDYHQQHQLRIGGVIGNGGVNGVSGVGIGASGINGVSATADTMLVSEMASAAGLECAVDPALAAALRNQKTADEHDEHLTACLLMVFVAVSVPKLARSEHSFYRASLEGHANNVHCVAAAVNAVFGALFTVCSAGAVPAAGAGADPNSAAGVGSDIEDRMKEFLALASSSLLRLGQEADRDTVRNRESVYLLLDQIVQESPFLTMDLLESCFPYALIRNAYHAVYKIEHHQHGGHSSSSSHQI
ncbi:membrane-associated protein Hem [Sipha flava]|uniref:Membrane-associated protein Hem n=2 Tax=Sipha flava TaxID=143950 RepID=A0A2S2QAL6_9HEMI|nr:membrane-associated protein Hem [Sipha flava]